MRLRCLRNLDSWVSLKNSCSLKLDLFDSFENKFFAHLNYFFAHLKDIFWLI